MTAWQPLAGWTLIHFLWHGCAIAAAAAVVLRLANRRSSTVRYAVACLALVAMVASPLVTARLLWDRPAAASVANTAPRDSVVAANIRVKPTPPDPVQTRRIRASSPVVAEGTFSMAELLLRSRRDDREQAARGLLTEISTRFSDNVWAPRALARRAAIEERSKLRVVDAQLNASVPAALVSYRTLVEQYPNAEGAEASLAKLADIYDDLKRYELAAKAFDNLAERFPSNSRDAVWRAAELYDKKIKDMNAARRAYAQVPASSSHYKDAQKRAQR